MRFRGALFRAHSPEWSWMPVSGEGASIHGGRFNRRGVAALYASVEPMTAILEAIPVGLPLQPLTLCEYEVDCDGLVDATGPSVRDALSIAAGELNCPEWERQMNDGHVPLSQALADRLIAQGYRGLRVPSFAPGAPEGASNLVFWDWGPEAPKKVVVIDDDRRLPRNPSSWRSVDQGAFSLPAASRGGSGGQARGTRRRGSEAGRWGRRPS